MAITKYSKNSDITKNISDIIYSAVKKNYSKKKIFLHEPFLDKDDIKGLKSTIESQFVSTAGSKINNFEEELKLFTKSKYVVAVNSGTSALHLSLLSIGVEKTNEVLVSSLSFIATSNSIMYCGATCHYVDLMDEGYGVDYAKLEKYLRKNCYIKNNECINKKTKKVIKALLAVHIFGSCNDLNKIKSICKKYKLKFVEDAAESLVSYYKNKHLGTIGDVGIISFNGNKIITTGSGGCILTNNKKIYLKVKSLSISCKINHKWNFLYSGLGYNYKMSNIQASLGLSQLKKIRKILKLKNKIFLNYKKSFQENKYFEFFNPPIYCSSNNWLNTIRLKAKYYKYRGKIIINLMERNIFCRPVWPIMSSNKHIKKCKGMSLVNSKKIEQSIICLPSSAR